MALNLGLRRWRRPLFWTVLALIVLEFPLTVTTLALFGIADPDTYRTKLWQDGSSNGFNSDPSTPLYAAANYLPPVKVPLVWSLFLTKYNLVIAILSMFILLLKGVLLPLKVLFPIFSAIIHATEVGLWSYSVYAQTSPDTIDPKHSNPGPPWYITKSCSVVFKEGNRGFCMQAKASFWVSCVMLALFSVQLLVAITGMLFSPPPSPHKTTSDPEKSLPFGGMFKSKSSRASSSHHSGIDDVPEREWEMVRIPDTPGTTGGMKSPPSSTTNVDGQEERQLGGERQLNPMTPRTTAFHALDGGQGKHAEPLPAWGLRREEKMPWSQRV